MTSIRTPMADGEAKRNSVAKLNLPAVEKKDNMNLIKKKRGGRKVYHDDGATD